MPNTSIDRILTGEDKAKDLSFLSYRDWLLRAWTLYPQMLHSRVPHWNGKSTTAPSVHAFVDCGRWLAQCPACSSYEDVDHKDPLFWCHACGCEEFGGMALPVVFPANRSEIEAALLKRPVESVPGLFLTERARRAKPLVPGLPRSWAPGQTLADIKRENKGAGL